ncbi:MAG: SDR family NAD(P)-dependent oxidoreductase [Methyloligellaceae bacterium]
MNQKTRTALITGSGRNIGRACAQSLARQGFNIIVNGSSNRENCEEVATEVRHMGVEAHVIMADVGRKDSVKELADSALQEYGGVDVLINNAAIRPNAGFLEISEEDWERVMNVNYKSAFWLARECLPGMVENNWGRIINFSGMNAMAGYAGKPHVTTSKHAAWGMTKALAKEFGPLGITTNIISPGTIVGEVKTKAQKGNLQALQSNTPSDRLGHPSDIAALVSLLVSDEGGFINGQNLQPNGGVVC